jgi:hypothetical protein
MSNGMTVWRQRRQAARARRAFARAVDTASTPAMQHELLSMASTRQWLSSPR